MLDTKLRPKTKDSAMWTSQIAIHIWISFVLNYIHKWEKKTKKTQIRTFDLRFLGFKNLKFGIFEIFRF